MTTTNGTNNKVPKVIDGNIAIPNKPPKEVKADPNRSKTLK